MNYTSSRAVALALVVVSSFGAVASARLAHAMTVPPGFQVSTVVSGLTLPTAFAFAPDGRLFIAEKSGSVVEVKNGVLQPTPVVQLTDINDYGDRGLEGIALDPNFSQNGYLYLAYTYENTPGQNYSGPKTGRIVRLTVVGDTASLASKVVILGSIGGSAAQPSCLDFPAGSDCIPSDSNTHSMGALHFGPDGKLYASLGDGAGYLGADPEALGAQNIEWLGGKMVRINTDGTAPADNPFYDGNPHDAQSKVWALGGRNMYRFNFRPSDNKMFIGAVGWATWESVYIGAKGANYGWPCLEGFATTTYDCTPSSAPVYPIYVFDHHTGTAAVIGGSFPTAFGASYAGNYFFGDYANDIIKRMVLNPDDTENSVTDFVTDAGGPVDIETAPDGTLYYAALNVGEIRKLSVLTPNEPPNAVVAANLMQGLAPFTVQFTGSGSSDPNGSTLSYLWAFGDGQTSTAANPSHTYGANGTYAPTLTVTNIAGLTSTASASIIVGQIEAGAHPHNAGTSVVPTPAIIGRQETITTNITNTGSAVPFIVDMEIYNSSNQQVAQQVFDGQTILTGGSASYSMQWLPPTVGSYTVKIGLFQAGWAGLYEWTDQALTIQVQNRAPAAPAFSQTTFAPSASAGSTDAISATVTDMGASTNALVDLEVYQNGMRVGQKFFDNQSFASGQSITYAYPFSVPNAGTYQVSVGVFQPGWGPLYTWFDQVAAFTASAGATSGASIYGDSLAAGWQDWSWNSTDNFSDTVGPFAGSDSLSVTYNAPWAGLYLHDTSPLSTNGKSALTFAVEGVGASGQNIQVFFYDAAGNQLAVKNISSYLPGGILAGKWSQVAIPLGDLNALGKSISGVAFQDVSGASGESIRLDSVGLQ